MTLLTAKPSVVSVSVVGSCGESDDSSTRCGAVTRTDDERGGSSVDTTESVCRHAGSTGQSGHRQLLSPWHQQWCEYAHLAPLTRHSRWCGEAISSREKNYFCVQFQGLLFLMPVLFSLDYFFNYFFPSKLYIFFLYILSEYTSKKLTVFSESRSERDFCMTGLQNYNIILTSVKGQEVSKS